MGLRIRTNISSLNAQRELGQSSRRLRTVYEKLTSGKRINKAADDPGGFGVSQTLRKNIRSLNAAKRNASDGISIIQTAEGGLNETQAMLVRLRELAIQAASDTVGMQGRDFIQLEYAALKDEIDRIASSTEFNGTRLLVGSRNHSPSDLDLSEDNTFPLEVQVNKDYFPEADDIENRNPINIIQLDFGQLDAYAEGLGIGASQDDDGTRVDSLEGAQNSIGQLDHALHKVNSYRAYLGSVQNRMTSTINNLEVHIENLNTSKSRIVDTDFAAQTANLTQENILRQSGASVLRSSNSSPEIVLSLIG